MKQEDFFTFFFFFLNLFVQKRINAVISLLTYTSLCVVQAAHVQGRPSLSDLGMWRRWHSWMGAGGSGVHPAQNHLS